MNTIDKMSMNIQIIINSYKENNEDCAIELFMNTKRINHRYSTSLRNKRREILCKCHQELGFISASGLSFSNKRENNEWTILYWHIEESFIFYASLWNQFLTIWARIKNLRLFIDFSLSLVDVCNNGEWNSGNYRKWNTQKLITKFIDSASTLNSLCFITSESSKCHFYNIQSISWVSQLYYHEFGKLVLYSLNNSFEFIWIQFVSKEEVVESIKTNRFSSRSNFLQRKLKNIFVF